MVYVIAVAGGHGDVGRTIVEVLGQNPLNRVLVLSRKEPGDDSSLIHAGYTDVAQMKESLEKNGVEVVISCLNLITPETSQAEIDLVRASNSASTTHRFIASQWSIKAPEGAPLPDFSSATLAELENTNLEYTVVSNGHFSDYYGFPKVKTHLKHADFLVDIANKTAAIPGSGDDKVAFTYSYDVAYFVDALVSTSKKWPKHSVIIGEKITIKELVAMAEEARGAKFSVVHDGLDKLKSLQVTELPSHIEAYKFFPKPVLQTMFAVINMWIIQGRFDLSYDGSLNEMFPHIKITPVKDLIHKAWSNSIA